MRESEGNRALERPVRRWKDYIKMCHKETAWQHGLGWSGLAEGRYKRPPLVTVDRVPQQADISFDYVVTTVSRRILLRRVSQLVS